MKPPVSFLQFLLMGLLLQLKHYLGNDLRGDYIWSKSIPVMASYQVDRKVRNNTILRGGGKCNLIIEENAAISIENNFTGIVVGRKNSTVRITQNFNGLLICENLIICDDAQIKGSLYYDKISIMEGVTVEARTYVKTQNFDDIELRDLKKITVTDFKNKYLNNYEA